MLLGLVSQHELHYHWVKGHESNVNNNRCDQQAVLESRNSNKTSTSSQEDVDVF